MKKGVPIIIDGMAIDLSRKKKNDDVTGDGDGDVNCNVNRDVNDVTHTLTQRHILAVGVEINFESVIPLIENELRKNDPSFEQLEPDPRFEFPRHIVLSGVYFGSAAPKQTQLKCSMSTNWSKEDQKQHANLIEKFKTMRTRHSEDPRAFMKSFHISHNGRLVVGEVYIGQDKFFVFFRNANGVPTTLIKKELSKVGSDHYTSNYRRVEFERTTLSYRPYIHYLRKGKHSLYFE